MLAIPHSSPAAAGTGVPHQVWPTSYSVASHHTDRCPQIPSPCSTARNGRSSGQAASQWVGQQGAGEHAGLLDQVGVAWQHELSVATPVSGDVGEPHCHGLVERQAPAGTGGATVGPHLRKAGAMTAGGGTLRWPHLPPLPMCRQHERIRRLVKGHHVARGKWPPSQSNVRDGCVVPAGMHTLLEQKPAYRPCDWHRLMHNSWASQPDTSQTATHLCLVLPNTSY